MAQTSHVVARPEIDVSVLIPAKNEAGNIAQLVTEISQALTGICAFEVVLVDDGSTDDTSARFEQTCVLQNIAGILICHQQSCGQSTALWSAGKQARGRFLVTIDGDGQNDPADIPALYKQALALPDSTVDFCIAGFRHKRQDSGWKKFQSKIANKVRRALLDDGVPDTGCGLKLIPKHSWQQLPYFDHMHRYLPALIKRMGGQIFIEPVNHRHRMAGQSNYGAWGRFKVGVVDLFGVRWLLKRNRLPQLAQLKVLSPTTGNDDVA